VRSVLVDAGALIALLDRDDRHHARCVAALKRIRQPLATVWPAVTEAMHLLADVPGAAEALLDLLLDGGVELLTVETAGLRRVGQLMTKYRDRPMDFADAVLVHAAERDGLTTILSFDADFSVYRLPGRARFVVIS
jgi:predicted nucleic acid-binding protein